MCVSFGGTAIDDKPLHTNSGRLVIGSHVAGFTFLRVYISKDCVVDLEPWLITPLIMKLGCPENHFVVANGRQNNMELFFIQRNTILP